ncbi:Flp family type IVb pilin [Pararhizobium qamdonense]|jgi:pilus assembly protein Flp/PilA|uniref:Flp family type IVb pilin n=1 Tax=Pararhizobium qamdonense TaxID=3031126 RepID=UPI0023E272FF|nr:Flp family type IVb pilin [Pararhizobium qamdonense]
MKTLMRFMNDNSGATAVEYGLLATLISAAMVVGLGAFSDNLLLVFQKITTTLAGAPK